VVELEAEGSDAVARTEGGAFSMTADGQGVVAVGTSSGWASLSAEGESIRIPAGMISVVPGKGKPKKPAQALRNVLLSVTWPERDETNQKTYPVAGQVEPGARVAIGGQEIRVDEHGRFKANVPLRQGKQRVGVVATDVVPAFVTSSWCERASELAPQPSPTAATRLAAQATACARRRRWLATAAARSWSTSNAGGNPRGGARRASSPVVRSRSAAMPSRVAWQEGQSAR